MHVVGGQARPLGESCSDAGRAGPAIRIAHDPAVGQLVGDEACDRRRGDLRVVGVCVVTCSASAGGDGLRSRGHIWELRGGWGRASSPPKLRPTQRSRRAARSDTRDARAGADVHKRERDRRRDAAGAPLIFVGAAPSDTSQQASVEAAGPCTSGAGGRTPRLCDSPGPLVIGSAPAAAASTSERGGPGLNLSTRGRMPGRSPARPRS